MKSVVGEREVVQVDSSENNLVIVKEDEEEAYEAIKEEFGVEPVRIIFQPEQMQFKSMEYDKELQVAELTYICQNKRIVYFISASFKDSSWGIDVEDTIVDQYIMEGRGCSIEIKEYETPKSKSKRFSASFKYSGIEYFMIATVDKDTFEQIIQNLHFVLE